MIPKGRFRIAIWIPTVVLLAGCGYRFSGSGNLPAGIQRVFVSTVANRTAETGLESVLTGDLRYEFIRNDRLAEETAADGVLTGVIKSLQVGTISRSGLETSLERRVSVSVDLKLTDRNGKVVWFVNGIAASESYRVVSDEQGTERNKRQALDTLLQRLAQNVYYRLTESF